MEIGAPCLARIFQSESRAWKAVNPRFLACKRRFLSLRTAFNTHSAEASQASLPGVSPRLPGSANRYRSGTGGQTNDRPGTTGCVCVVSGRVAGGTCGCTDVGILAVLAVANVASRGSRPGRLSCTVLVEPGGACSQATKFSIFIGEKCLFMTNKCLILCVRGPRFSHGSNMGWCKACERECIWQRRRL